MIEHHQAAATLHGLLDRRGGNRWAIAGWLLVDRLDVGSGRPIVCWAMSMTSSRWGYLGVEGKGVSFELSLPVLPWQTPQMGEDTGRGHCGVAGPLLVPQARRASRLIGWVKSPRRARSRRRKCSKLGLGCLGLAVIALDARARPFLGTGCDDLTVVYRPRAFALT